MAIKTETREVHDFTAVEVQGTGMLEVHQGESESLEITADEAILERLISRVQDGRLTISYDLAWWEWLTWWFTYAFVPDKTVRYNVTMKQVQGLAMGGSGIIKASDIQTDRLSMTMSGSGAIGGDRLTCERLDLMVSGSGKVHLGELQLGRLTMTISGSGEAQFTGKANSQELHISGSGKVRAQELATQETAVTISGSGEVWVDTAERLDVRISGSGDVLYKGTPRVSQHISGSGKVEQLAGSEK